MNINIIQFIKNINLNFYNNYNKFLNNELQYRLYNKNIELNDNLFE